MPHAKLFYNYYSSLFPDASASLISLMQVTHLMPPHETKVQSAPEHKALQLTPVHPHREKRHPHNIPCNGACARRSHNANLSSFIPCFLSTLEFAQSWQMSTRVWTWGKQDWQETPVSIAAAQQGSHSPRCQMRSPSSHHLQASLQ